MGRVDLPTFTNESNPSHSSLEAFVKPLKAWLKECDNEHSDQCAPKYVSQQLPKRLISIAHQQKIKIIEVKERKLDPQTVKYIALSHKWGAMPEEAKTTTSNLEQRKKRIPENELPLTFKNVIAITRALGLEYLWIDTLCIIQGPDGDFASQADTMQTTFNHAYCVIAACSAQNATDGLLPKRDVSYIRLDNIIMSAVTNDFERDVLNSPLQSRGWVLQERALARRTIFFSNTQIYMECGNGIRCETGLNMKK